MAFNQSLQYRQSKGSFAVRAIPILYVAGVNKMIFSVVLVSQVVGVVVSVRSLDVYIANGGSRYSITLSLLCLSHVSPLSIRLEKAMVGMRHKKNRDTKKRRRRRWQEMKLFYMNTIM